MDSRVTGRVVTVVGESVVITESIKTTLNKKQLEDSLRQIQAKKARLQEQNARVLAEYNALEAEEIETNDLLNQFTIEVIPLEVISKDV